MVKRNELKKRLIADGFEVYRTLPDRIQLADRVRDNLIMDSGVSIGFDPQLSVRFVVRAQRNDFPGDDDQALFEQARALAQPMAANGYVEVSREVVSIQDPGDKSRTLDTWFEVTFQLDVDSIETLNDELQKVLPIEKTASPARRH